MSDPRPFDRLTRRQRACLRLVGQLQGSSEIAGVLGIATSTVDGDLAEAVRHLGARDRHEAALLLDRHERAAGHPPVLSGGDPQEFRGDYPRLFPPPDPLPIPVSPDEPIVGASRAGQDAPTARSTGLRFPFRRKGQAGNDLSVGDRLIWIQVIAVGAAVGFGMLATGLQVLADLLARVTGHLS